MHMIGHGMALDQFNPLLLAQLPDDPPDTASELPIDDPASVLRHNNNVIRAVPADVRLALPVSHENLLPSERGGSLKGGSLLYSCARRNGRASASLTARGGGLPVGVREWCCLDLAASHGVMVINGAQVGQGRGAEVMGHPLKPLVWLANMLAERGKVLKVGMTVITRSIIPPKPLSS